MQGNAMLEGHVLFLFYDDQTDNAVVEGHAIQILNSFIHSIPGDSGTLHTSGLIQ